VLPACSTRPVLQQQRRVRAYDRLTETPPLGRRKPWPDGIVGAPESTGRRVVLPHTFHRAFFQRAPGRNVPEHRPAHQGSDSLDVIAADGVAARMQSLPVLASRCGHTPTR
jgi:hypothetical protein